ncbi:MAG TPA: hypothetical protein VGB70_06270 [Allosphingosinicella sp.]|jgi:hypothetical protein
MRKSAVLTVFAAAVGMAACATYYDDGYGQGRGGYDYVGRDFDRPGNDCGFFGGSGGRALDPWLACTAEGQGIVRRGFDSDGDRRISSRTAERANIWFRRHADTNRDMRLTDPEVRAALVNAERFSGR